MVNTEACDKKNESKGNIEKAGTDSPITADEIMSEEKTKSADNDMEKEVEGEGSTEAVGSTEAEKLSSGDEPLSD